jgi:hypothetical protein
MVQNKDQEDVNQYIYKSNLNKIYECICRTSKAFSKQKLILLKTHIFKIKIGLC